jgi:lipopolysaccharide biosynthesis glycosyltransferase
MIGNKLHLLIDYYKNPRPERAEELDFCFLENINSKEFDYIHVFQESPLPIKDIPSNVIVNQVQGRSTYQYYFDYAKKNIPQDDIIVLSNSDIFFDESISKVKEIDLSDKVLALTRFCPYQGHWLNEEGYIIPYDIHHRSQDVWIWKNPLNIDTANFNTGVLGCDNKIAFELHKVGYQVWNPSFSIICYHKHAERNDEKDYISPIKTWLSRPYLLPSACSLENIKDENYKFYISIE